jgi:ferredoxin-NADP reductase
MIQVKVTQLTREAEGILGIELQAADGATLVRFEPGAHIDVHLADGLTRQYSLCNDASEADRYRLGVGLSATSRGGRVICTRRFAKATCSQSVSLARCSVCHARRPLIVSLQAV